MQLVCQTRFANILQTCESHGHKVAGPGAAEVTQWPSGGAGARRYGDNQHGDTEIWRHGNTVTMRMRLVPLVLALMAATCWGEERLLAGPLPSLIDTIDSLGGSRVSVECRQSVDITTSVSGPAPGVEADLVLTTLPGGGCGDPYHGNRR